MKVIIIGLHFLLYKCWKICKYIFKGNGCSFSDSSDARNANISLPILNEMCNYINLTNIH